MPIIIASDQLVGRFQVTQNTKNVTIIEEYIDSVEKSTIIEMLGADLGNAFWDDCQGDGAPTEPRFEAFLSRLKLSWRIHKLCNFKLHSSSFVVIRGCSWVFRAV